ncbi:hypothetical protein [Paenibacillus sp. FSL L8-0709]|uniref:hypothetical protein n=1 Tax=Paenibacillus sp. FSL L8-0709 TaxID=2975312 RepID=UPI0030FBA0B0
MKRICSFLLCLGLFFSQTSLVNAGNNKVNLSISKEISYYGEVLNGKPNGQGTMKWGAYKSYLGSWKNGKRSGYGKFVIIDYSQAEKDFDGRMDNVRTTTYIGQWNEDMKNGEGILTDKVNAFHSGNQDDLIQKGQFKNNVFIKGNEVHTYWNNYSDFLYKDDSINVSFQTSDDIQDLYQDTYNLDYEEFNDLEEIIDYGAYENLTFQSKSTGITYKYAHLLDNEYGAFTITRTKYVNNKMVEELVTDAEVDNINMSREIERKLQPYLKGFELTLKMLYQ